MAGRDPDAAWRLALGAVAAGLAAAAFPILLVLVVDGWGPFHRLDVGVATDLNTLAAGNPDLVRALKAVSTVLGPIAFRVAAVLLALWLARRGLRRLALFTAFTVLLGGVLVTVVKLLVGRDRPLLAHPVADAAGSSFRSGHAFGAVVGAGTLLLVLLPAVPRRARPLTRVLCVLVVLAVGWSRIGLGVHYVSDVVGGYVLGLAWLAEMTAAFRAWRRDVGHPPADLGAGLEPEAGTRLTGHLP